MILCSKHYSFDAYRLFFSSMLSIPLESISSTHESRHRLSALKFKFIRELGSKLGMKKKIDKLWFNPVAP